MMKFLTESTDTPHVSGVTREHLPLPNPGIDEYRIYFDEHETTHDDYSHMGEDGETEPKQVTELTASFVSCSCDHEPTDDEWTELLGKQGYSKKQIAEILGAENAEEDA